MAKEKNYKKKISENKKPRMKKWKIVSLVFIAIFLLILVLGILRIYHFNSMFHKITNDDTNSINSVKSSVYNYMLSSGENISMDNIKTFDRVREFNINNTEKKLIGVSVIDGTSEDFFLVDIDSKEIMMHSHTEFYGWLNNSKSRFFRPPPFQKEQRPR